MWDVNVGLTNRPRRPDSGWVRTTGCSTGESSVNGWPSQIPPSGFSARKRANEGRPSCTATNGSMNRRTGSLKVA